MAGPSLILEIEAVAHIDLEPGEPGIAEVCFLDTPAGVDLALQVGRAILEAPDACQRISTVEGDAEARRVSVKVAVVRRQDLRKFLDEVNAGITLGLEHAAGFLNEASKQMIRTPPAGMKAISGPLATCILQIARMMDTFVEARTHG